MSYKTFFIVGAQRSGTTYLCKILDEHPQILMAKPLKPEPKFFLNDEEYDRGISFYLQKYYPPDTSGMILGEKSTSYLEYSFVAQRIYSYFSDAKILISLRNPVFRAISNYFFSYDFGLETRTLHEVFIQKIPPPSTHFKTSVSPFEYLKRGEYISYIKPFFETFGRDNVQIVFFESYIGNSEAISQIYKFLEVKSDFQPTSMNLKINSTNRNKNIDNSILSFLEDYYTDRNELLRQYLRTDLSFWSSTWGITDEY